MSQTPIHLRTWRLWAEIAGGIIIGGVCLDLIHHFLAPL